MTKWADYGISAVRYNQQHTHIDQVKVHVDTGEVINSASIWLRADVVKALEKGNTFVTILKNAEGKWVKGQTVYVITVKGVKYIKTVDNGKEADNLENLPEF
ncbi:DUF3892 domain-containing protein [Citrifermentans bremense]|uniref:DUF3892 domain-containing protein n=1 Tax=Citrifermentans bremense TaxID=60035 RepID=UPI000425020B|nr:DUF3892 domain-containing protein [Citrifermentans bremense]